MKLAWASSLQAEGIFCPRSIFLVAFLSTLAIFLLLCKPAVSAVKKELPPITSTTSFRSTTDSSRPDEPTVTFSQSVKFGPFKYTHSFFGNTAQMELTYQLFTDIQEIRRTRGRSRDRLRAYFGIRDYAGKAQVSFGYQSGGTFFPAPSDPAKTGIKFDESREMNYAQMLGRSALLTASVRLSQTASGVAGSRRLNASEALSGSYSLEAREKGIHFLFTSSTSERKVFGTSVRSGFQSNNWLFEFSKDLPIGRISSQYRFLETMESPISPMDEPKRGANERLSFNLNGRFINSVSYRASLSQERKVAPSKLLSETNRQNLDLSYALPLPSPLSATLAFKTNNTQAESVGNKTSMQSNTYSLNLKPAKTLSVSASVQQSNKTDIIAKKQLESLSKASATISYNPIQGFGLNLQISDSTQQDFRTLGGKHSAETIAVGSAFKPTKELSLNMRLENTKRESIPAELTRPIGSQDTTISHVGLTYSPGGRFSLTASFRSIARHFSPEHRTIQNNISVRFSLTLSQKASWTFSLEGEESLDRNNPLNNRDKNVISSTLILKF